MVIVAEDLDQLRKEIERIDRALVGLMRERVYVARLVLRAKEAAGLPVVDAAQERAVLERAATTARAAGLPPEDVGAVFERLVEITRRVELAMSGKTVRGV
jgi:chorismate mutase